MRLKFIPSSASLLQFVLQSTNLSADIFNLHTNYKIGSLLLKGHISIYGYVIIILNARI